MILLQQNPYRLPPVSPDLTRRRRVTWPDLTPQKESGDLMTEQADAVGMAATCMDAGDIRRLDMPAFNLLAMYFKVST